MDNTMSHLEPVRWDDDDRMAHRETAGGVDVVVTSSTTTTSTTRASPTRTAPIVASGAEKILPLCLVIFVALAL